MEVVLLLILWTACAAFAGWIAKEKGRPGFELAIGLGFLLGPLGVLAVLVMANREAKPTTAYRLCEACGKVPATCGPGGRYCGSCVPRPSTYTGPAIEPPAQPLDEAGAFPPFTRKRG